MQSQGGHGAPPLHVIPRYERRPYIDTSARLLYLSLIRAGVAQW
jgi:hypothetical protein